MLNFQTVGLAPLMLGLETVSCLETILRQVFVLFLWADVLLLVSVFAWCLDLDSRPRRQPFVLVLRLLSWSSRQDWLRKMTLVSHFHRLKRS